MMMLIEELYDETRLVGIFCFGEICILFHGYIRLQMFIMDDETRGWVTSGYIAWYIRQSYVYG